MRPRSGTENREPRGRQLADQRLRRTLVVLLVVPLTAGILFLLGSESSERGPSQSGYSTLPRGADTRLSLTNAVQTTPAAKPSNSQSGEIRIAIADLQGGQVRFFEHRTSEQNRIRFFAVKGCNGSYHTGLDGCPSCYPAKMGYYQQGEMMICRKCGKPFPIARLSEQTGGCRPAEVPRVREGEHLVVEVANLEQIEKQIAANPPASRS